MQSYLTWSLEEVGVTEGRAETKDVIPFGVFWYGLHDGTVDNDEVLGRSFNWTSFSRVAGVEQERGALQANPVALPATLSGELNLVLFAKQPLLHTQEPAKKKAG